MINPAAVNLTALPQLPLAFYPNLPAVAALYFCTSEGEFLYIGITKNLSARWRSHHKLIELIRYDNVVIQWLRVDLEEICPELERAFINHWEPSLNDRTENLEWSPGLSPNPRKLKSHPPLTNKNHPATLKLFNQSSLRAYPALNCNVIAS